MNIGIFDSGLGGLAILREILKVLPKYNYVYFGDNAHVPYGGRSSKTIYRLTKNAVDYLFQKNCKLIILACNTATAAALRRLQQEYLPKKYPDRRILGVIRPTVESVVKTKGKRVGVIGTYAMVISKSFVAELKKFNKNIQVYQQACPLLVPLIEKGEIHWKGLTTILQKYLEPLKKKQIDTLILGCTHYGLIDTTIKKIVGKKIKVVSEGAITALKLKDYLRRHPEIEVTLTKKGKRIYYITGRNSRYRDIVKYFLGRRFKKGNRLLLARI